MAPQALGVLQVVPVQPEAQEVHWAALVQVRLQAGGEEEKGWVAGCMLVGVL